MARFWTGSSIPALLALSLNLECFMNLKNLLSLENIVPAVLALAGMLLILSGGRSSELAGGTMLYEKSNAGFTRVTTLPGSTEARLKAWDSGYYLVSIREPALDMWVSASSFTPGLRFPQDLLIRAKTGTMQDDFPPFRGHTIALSLPDNSSTTSLSSVFFLFFIVIVLIAMLSMKSQTAKNSILVLLGFFFLMYAVYTGGLLKSGEGVNTFSPVLIEPVLNTDSTNILYCQNRTLYDYAASLTGNRRKLELTDRPGSISAGFLLWQGNPGGGWRQVSSHQQYGLFQK
jgi:hypothetical protein